MLDIFKKYFRLVDESHCNKMLYISDVVIFHKKTYFQLIWIFHLFNFEYIFKHIQTPANRSLKWYHPSLLPHHHNNNHNKIRWSAKAQPKLEMALALFLTHHSFKILSLTHICLHLVAYFFLFIFSFYFLILKTETLLLLTHN